MTVYFGFAETEITPRGSVTLGGYVARSAKSEGVVDPLYAHVLSFREDDRRFVLVVLDLLGLTRSESDLLSESLAALTNLKPDDFEFACTHTHAAPNVIASPLIGDAPVEREYLDALPERLAGAVRNATGSEVPLEADWSQGKVEGVGASRTHANESDTILMTILSLNGVCAVEFACHPTVLGHENLLVSGDLFGAARRSLSRRLAAPVVFLQGASADISTRYTRREQSLDEVRRLGGLLADAAHEIWRRAEPKSVSGLSVGRTSVELPLKEGIVSEGRLREAEVAFARAREILSLAELRRAQTELEGLRIEARLAGTEDLESHCPVFVAGIGGIRLVGIGGELPSGLGREICERSPSLRPTVVLGCAGGYVGYLMGRDAEPGSYEALASPYEAGAGNLIVEAALKLLDEIV